MIDRGPGLAVGQQRDRSFGAGDKCIRPGRSDRLSGGAATSQHLTWRVFGPASAELALCNMKTLYLRNVPDDVVERLERLAALDATSVSAVAVRELAAVSRRADNPALLGALPDLAITTASIVGDVEAERALR